MTQPNLDATELFSQWQTTPTEQPASTGAETVDGPLTASFIVMVGTPLQGNHIDSSAIPHTPWVMV
jgi:hypothetical protein